MERYSRVYETVNLDAIRQNMEAMRANLKEGTGMIGVVKADGYGRWLSTGGVCHRPIRKRIRDGHPGGGSHIEKTR